PERDHGSLPALRRVVIEHCTGERVTHRIRAIDAIGQHKRSRILEDVLRIWEVQRLAVFEKWQRLIADQTGKRRALQHAMPRCDSFNRSQETGCEVPRTAGGPRTAS